MTRPPALGPHARHRSLGTPGPTGYNDHGDPGHRRRRGATPGPLGHNDHGMPLSIKPRRVDVYDDEVTMMINGIIEQANGAMASAVLESKLQFCIDLAKQNRRDKSEEDQRYRDVECYFQARMEEIEGRANISNYLTGQATAWASDFFERGWIRAGDMPLKVLHPSYDRLGKWSRGHGDQPIPGPYDSALRWAANGAVDRLRDHSLGEGELQTHKRPLTSGRTISAFPRAHTD
jgi:hypothetical protein